MNVEELLEKLKTAFMHDGEGEAETIIEENADVWKSEKDFGIKALELAVEQGCTEYVQNHVPEFDPFNLGYLHDKTTDNDMHETLAELSVFRDAEDFFDCKFAMETTNGTVLAFQPEFQRECWDKFRELHPCSDEDVLRILGVLEEEGDLDFVELEDEEYEIARACTLLNVREENGGIVLEDFDDTLEKEYWDLSDLIDELGYETRFEGDSWKLETNGVYYIE